MDDKLLDLLRGILTNSGNILTRAVMETSSLNFEDMVDKMTAPLICGVMDVLKEHYPEEFNKQVDTANYLLIGKIKTPYAKFDLPAAK